MPTLLTLSFLLAFAVLSAQPRTYSTANAHSHNDYEQSTPFYSAFKNRFGSIEADIFLVDGQLYVAHTWGDLNKEKRTLDSLYLKPLADCVKRNRGSVYPDPSLKLQFLVDIKTSATPTLNRLVEALKKYPELTTAKSIQIVISGNRPGVDSFHLFPSYIYFDGLIGATYNENALSRIPLFSASFREFSAWKGYGKIPAVDSMALAKAIIGVHKLRKPIRLWAAPDHPAAWQTLMNLGVDYLNTDNIEQISEFLKKK